MREKDVIRSLKAAAGEKVVIDEERKRQLIGNIVSRELPVRKKCSFPEFVISQIRFIDKKVWFWQGMWMLLFFYVVRQGNLFHITNETLCILSMAPPLLLLLTVEEVARVYNRSMLEIEYATKYSLKKVVLVRMMILGAVNAALIAVGILFARGQTGMRLIEVLVYSLTPLLLMTFLLLKIMTRCKGGQINYAGVALYFCFLLLILIGRMERFDIYMPDAFEIWLLCFVCGMAATIYQFAGLIKRLDCFEVLLN